ncbi:hypothetical protein [Wolbachia endosymbiont (group A) of Barypeithes pellucidus]|uniref:hypothetical protein n=1 Tax=Wolbachia endosymbiont (group A) of Barypeithes pellucidus TaxID=3139322 RepID=UPI003CCB6234
MPVSPSKIENSTESWNDADWKLFNAIREKATRKDHKHESPKKNGDGTIKKCIEFFKKGAGPKVLIQLEESLKEREEYYNYYTKNFLPALKAEITNSKKLDSKKKVAIVQTILEITNRSSNVSSIPSAVKENIEDQMQLGHIEEQNNTQETPLNVAEKKSGDNKILGQLDIPKEVSRKYSKVMEQLKKNIKTPKLGNGSGSDSGIDSPGLSEKNSISPINSRKNSLTSIASTSSEESLNSTLSSVEEDNGLQPEGGEKTELLESNLESPKENETQVQPEQTVKKEPKMQENENSDGQANPDQVKKDILLKNQPNNRNLHVAFVAGCALSTIGCIVAGAMTSGLIGAGLLAMAAVFAIAAVAELHSNFLSSKLTSINVSPLVDDKELTACSQR